MIMFLFRNLVRSLSTPDARVQRETPEQARMSAWIAAGGF